MALKEYEVTINGVETTVQLSDDDVKRYPDAKAVKRPANKAGAPSGDK